MAPPARHVGRALALALALASAPAPAQAADALRSAVGVLAGQLSDGVARLDASELVVRRARNRVAVLFALEGPGGGNGRWQFLALYEPNESLRAGRAVAPRYRLLALQRIGARGERLFDAASARFDGTRLLLQGAAFRAGDAMCCPSRPISRAFVLVDGRIAESAG
ncbi:MAG TPA: hypothetical protein VLM17_06995 [Xanthomonadaceae bacterium]|nr:hypothetical protein [Xanthomonadaceae bacterium]